MAKRRNRSDGRGEVEERGPRKVRLILDIVDRIRTLTPREIGEMPYETVREVMLFLGIDPDEPLPDEILCLVDKLQSQRLDRPEVRAVASTDAIEPGENSRALMPEERDSVADREAAGPSEILGEHEPSALSRVVAGPVRVGRVS